MLKMVQQLILKKKKISGFVSFLAEIADLLQFKTQVVTQEKYPLSLLEHQELMLIPLKLAENG